MLPYTWPALMSSAVLNSNFIFGPLATSLASGVSHINCENSSNCEYTTARLRGKVAVPVMTPEVPVDEPSMTIAL